MAYTTDDLFGDNLLGDPNDLDNLVEFRDNDNNSDAEGDVHNDQGGDADDKDDEDQEGKKEGEKKPDAKIVRIKRPQPKLDADRLKGPRGLKELRKTMGDIKYHGKGHEAEDLQRMMARLEHWAHRLFPKFQFDDFIEKVEKLGSKKVVQNYVKRMRMGLVDDDDDENRPPNSDEEAVDDPAPIADETMGEFDRLLAEQVSLHQNNSISVNSPQTPGAGTPRTPAFPRPGQAVSSTPVPSLTPEQRARMEANRLAALERRRARMEAVAAAAAASAAADTEQSVPTTSSSTNGSPSKEPISDSTPSPDTTNDAERRARIEANRLAALERRRAHMEAAAAAASAVPSITSTLTSNKSPTKELEHSSDPTADEDMDKEAPRGSVEEQSEQ